MALCNCGEFHLQKWGNLFAILSLLIMQQTFNIIFGFLPYFTVVYTTIIFNIKFNKNLKKILTLSISDFIIRVIALFVNFYLSGTQYGGEIFKIVSIAMIVLFILNLFVEYLIQLRMEKFHEISNELTIQEIIDNGSEDEIFKSVKSLKESAFLYIICLLILGYKRSSGGTYILFYIIPFLLLLYKYIESTYNRLFIYYKDKDRVIRNFSYENLGILLMLVLMIIYGFLKNGDGAKEFIIYAMIALLSLPRYFSRRKRIKEVYKNHMTR